jgi:hypothetical protein
LCSRNPTETIVAEKTEAMVAPGISNSRMKDFTDIAMAARRVTFDGGVLVAALRATFRRRSTPLLDAEMVGLSDRFVQDASAQASWKAFAARNRPRDFESLVQIMSELRRFLHDPLEHARRGEPFTANWNPGGPWTSRDFSGLIVPVAPVTADPEGATRAGQGRVSGEPQRAKP